VCVSPPNPIPAIARGHAIGGKEVVPGASELAVDEDPTMGAGEDLVAKAKLGLPGTALGACLGCARL